jgi:hypothetical protein
VGGVFEHNLREKWGMIVFIQSEKPRPGGPSFFYSSPTMQNTLLWTVGGHCSLTASIFFKETCVKFSCRK